MVLGEIPSFENHASALAKSSVSLPSGQTIKTSDFPSLDFFAFRMRMLDVDGMQFLILVFNVSLESDSVVAHFKVTLSKERTLVGGRDDGC